MVGLSRRRDAVPATRSDQRGEPPPPRTARRGHAPATQPPPRNPHAPGAPVVGKGSISGAGRRRRVGSAGAPGARQPVGQQRGGRGRSTDDRRAGRFAFSALPEGRFTCRPPSPGTSAARTGSAAGPAGHADPARRRPALSVQLQIMRGGVITGTVLDENAEAIPGTPVRALRYVMQSGQRTLQSAGQRADRRSRRLPDLRSAARRVPRVRHAAQRAIRVPDVARQAEQAARRRRARAWSGWRARARRGASRSCVERLA